MSNLKLVDLTKRFGRIIALNNLNLEVKEGEYIVILGPTGAGKTTLLRTIAGLEKQDSGDVYIGSQLVNELLPEEREVAYLSQTYSLFPLMTVWENTIFSPSIKNWDTKKTNLIGREMLEMVRLMKRANAFPHELSGGMQQRNALARALASNARVLLLDEPLRALDARLRIELRHELRALAKTLKITTLHVTHDQEEAMTVSDRIVVLRKGNVLQIGNPYEIFNKAASPFVANFVGRANFIECEVKEIDTKNMKLQDSKGTEIIVIASDFNPGDKVLVGVKIDKTELEIGERRGVNTFIGKLNSITFLGRIRDFEIVCEDGRNYHASLPSTLSAQFTVGTKVTLSFTPEHANVFPYPKEGLKSAIEVG